MLEFNPREMTVPEVHRLLVGGVAPRPIALVSTVSKEGVDNLAPYSFFNTFGANPPMVAFSPSRRGSNGSLKDTYNNLVNTGECVIQAVTYNIVSQVSVASAEYLPDVDEFVKSGLTKIESTILKPKRVKESPFQMECILKQMIPLGDKNASGNLAICEVVKFHVDENIIVNGTIEPNLIDLVSRMSANYYCRANGSAIFSLEQPNTKLGVGFDNLPDIVKNSKTFSGYELGRLASIQVIPTPTESKQYLEQYRLEENCDEDFPSLFQTYTENSNIEKLIELVVSTNKNDIQTKIETLIKITIERNQIEVAWHLISLLK